MKASRLILNAIKNNKKCVAIFFLGTIVSSYCITYIPIVIQYILDKILNPETTNVWLDSIPRVNDTIWGFLISMCLCLFILRILIEIINYIKGISKNKAIQRIEQELKMKVVEYIQELTYQEFNKTAFSDLVQKATQDITNIVQFIDKQFTFLIEVGFICIFAMIQLVQIDIRLSPIIMIACILIIFCSVMYYKYSKKYIKEKIDIQNELYTKMEDNYANQQFIRVNNLQEIEQEKFETSVETYFNKSRRVISIDSVFGRLISMIIQLQAPAIFILGGYLYYIGSITLGSIFVVLQYSNKVTNSFKEVNEIIAYFNSFMESYRRLNILLHSQTEEESEITQLPNLDIQFDHVSISIQGETILEDLTFTIQENEKILLLGATGSGKTILCQTLIGFYSYTGSITIGGVELREINKKVLREYICMLLQDSYVYSKTIEENITLLIPDMKEEEMYEIAKDFQIYEDITALKDKFQTMVGTRGVTLSKGQKQRLILARAFAKQKPIMIYDDSFSAIDNINKQKIMRKVLQQNQSTIIMITYDMHHVQDFDKIIYLENRKAILGTHDELMQQENYAKIYELSKDKLGVSYE